jgi:hypothetical protein
LSRAGSDAFADLLAFGHAMAARLAPISGAPVAYGSLAFIAHTADWRLGLADIDFLAPHAVFPSILAACRADPALGCEETTYHSIKVRRGELKLSFDSIDHYMAGIALQPATVTIGGFDFQVVDRAALVAAYERGAETIPIKRGAYLAKLARLRSTNPG